MPSGWCFISIFAASTWKSAHNVFMHIYFSDNTLTCSSVTQDAAHISIKHVLKRSVDHKGSSQQAELQPWCYHGKSFRDGYAALWGRWDEMQRTGSSQAQGGFQSSPAHLTNFTLRMAWQIGYGNGPWRLFYLMLNKEAALNKGRRDSEERKQRKRFCDMFSPQMYPTKDSLCSL